MSSATGQLGKDDYRNWFNHVVQRPKPQQRLMCVSGAGTGPSEFLLWRSILADDTELWPVQLPGRERRLREEPCSDLSTLITQLAAALHAVEQATAPVPLVLFGHSFGALVMYELAQHIATRNPHLLQGLVMSGLAAPNRPTRRAPVADMNDDELLDWVRKLDGTPTELLEDRRFTEWLLRDVRSSYRIRDNYAPKLAAPLPCPITVVGGREDFEADEQDLAAWSDRTASWFRCHTLPGGHFFLRQHREMFLELLAQEITAMRSTAPGVSKADS